MRISIKMISSRTILVFVALLVYSDAINIDDYSRLIYSKNKLFGLTTQYQTTVRINDAQLMERFEYIANSIEVKYTRYFIYTDPFSVTGNLIMPTYNNQTLLSQDNIDKFNFLLNVEPHPHYTLMDSIFIYLQPFDVVGEINNQMFKFDFNTTEMFRLNFNFTKDIIKLVIFNKYNSVFSYTRWVAKDITITDVGQTLLNITGHHNTTVVMKPNNIRCPLYCQNYNIEIKPFTVECETDVGYTNMNYSLAELFRIKPRYNYINKNVVIVKELFNKFAIIQAYFIFYDIQDNQYINDSYIRDHYQFLNNTKDNYMKNVHACINKSYIPKPTTSELINTTMLNIITDHIKNISHTTKEIKLEVPTTPYIKSNTPSTQSIQAEVLYMKDYKYETPLPQNDKHTDMINSKIKIIIIISVVVSITIITIVIAVLVFIFFIKKQNPKIKIETGLLETLM